MAEHILDELDWRGLIQDTTDRDALRRDLDAGPLTLYSGFDPTAPSLHAGHLVPLLTLRRFQRAGHRPIALAGGATGMIGDPRDIGERALLSAEVVADQTVRIRRQLERFVEFNNGPDGALLANNLDWTGPLSVVDFLRDIGKHFSVNVMLSRDTVRRRLDGDGMSFTEFSYLLLQSNDFLQLFRQHNCRLQVGGSDQWGNILGGVDLVRRVDGAHVHALTTPLITDAQGRKFGKSTGGGNIWLDPELTSPYAWFQYFVNVEDQLVGRHLRLFTELPQPEIEELEQLTVQRPQARSGQRRLAQELTTLVHGADQTRRVMAASDALFGRGELRELDEPTLAAAMAQAPTGQVLLTEQPTILDLLLASGLVDSRGAARRAVNEGGAYVNNAKITDESWQPTVTDLLPGRWLVLRRGKRTAAGVKAL